MSYPLRTAAAVTALGLAGAAVWTFSGGSEPDADRNAVALGRIANIALTTEHDCSDLLAYYKSQATRVVGPYGLGGGPRLYATAERASDGAAGKSLAPNAAGGGADSSRTGAPDSSTNVQVAGVDESDIVKTRGDLMVAVINGEVRITRLAGGETKTLATWRPADGAAQSVLLDGSTAVILGDQNGGIPLAATKVAPNPDGYNAAVTDLTVLDLADPAHPRPVRRLELGGTRSGEARLMDGELRVALTAEPSGFQWEQPVFPSDIKEDPLKTQAKFEQAEKRALAANKRLIAASTIADWIPTATVTPLGANGKPSGSPVTRPLMDCEQVAIPGSFSGLSTLALVSTDLHADDPLTTWRAAGVIAAGTTVYATADHVWLATSRWDAIPIEGPARASVLGEFAPSAASTQIHRFDTPPGQRPQYVASGEIPGSLLSQFAMDEKDGQLRVASTTEGSMFQNKPGTEASLAEDAAGETPVSDSGSSVSSGGTGGGTTGTATKDSAPGSGSASSGAKKPVVAPDGTADDVVPPSSSRARPKPSEGRVTVLKVDGTRLTQVGVVTGLGVGERIRGVRFVGDVGYVVTYRQTDPLYTVDLSDPAHPRVRGDLAVLGYSAYLHPAGDGRLLGLGQDGTEEGRTTALQLSLFDVSNLDRPRRLDRTRLAEAWSDVEGDHHAFTMAGDLVLIPYTSWSSVQPAADVRLAGPLRDRFDAGVIAVRVGSDGLGTPTTLRPIANGPVTFDASGQISKSVQRLTEATPMRTVVFDGTIYTLTAGGVAVHSATDFDRLTFARF